MAQVQYKPSNICNTVHVGLDTPAAFMVPFPSPSTKLVKILDLNRDSWEFGGFGIIKCFMDVESFFLFKAMYLPKMWPRSVPGRTKATFLNSVLDRRLETMNNRPFKGSSVFRFVPEEGNIPKLTWVELLPDLVSFFLSHKAKLISVTKVLTKSSNSPWMVSGTIKAPLSFSYSSIPGSMADTPHKVIQGCMGGGFVLPDAIVNLRKEEFPISMALLPI